MDLELTAALPCLRDVEGVVASFVLSDAGEVVARDAPSYLDDAALFEVAPRLSRFHEAMSSTGDFLDFFVLEYGQQALHARRVPNGFLCLLTGAAVNGPSLRMAVNLMARKVGDRIAQRQARPEAPLPLAATAAPAMRPPPPPLPYGVSGRGSAPSPPPAVPRATPTASVAASRQSSTRLAVPALPPSMVPKSPARPLRVYRGTIQKD